MELGKSVVSDEESVRQSCPRCLGQIEGYPAVSRTDDATEICSPCGQTEAMESFMYEVVKTQDMWPTYEGFAKKSYWNKMNKLSGLITDLTKTEGDKNE